MNAECMKKRHRGKSLICLFCIVVLCLCLFAGCGNDAENDKDKADAASGSGSVASSSLYDEGLELASDIYELANDKTYMELMGLSSGLEEHIDEVAACNYESPSGVYRVENARDIFELAVLGFELEKGSMSEAAYKRLENTGAQFANVLIGRMGGVEQLAAASVLSTSSCFVNTSLAETEAYIYTYADAYPVIVTFVPGKNGAVSAGAQCLYLDALRGADVNAVNDMISGMGYPVSLVFEEITE